MNCQVCKGRPQKKNGAGQQIKVWWNQGVAEWYCNVAARSQHGNSNDGVLYDLHKIFKIKISYEYPLKQLTYPTLGKGKSSSNFKHTLGGDMSFPGGYPCTIPSCEIIKETSEHRRPLDVWCYQWGKLPQQAKWSTKSVGPFASEQRPTHNLKIKWIKFAHLQAKFSQNFGVIFLSKHPLCASCISGCSCFQSLSPQAAGRTHS